MVVTVLSSSFRDLLLSSFCSKPSIIGNSIKRTSSLDQQIQEKFISMGGGSSKGHILDILSKKWDKQLLFLLLNFASLEPSIYFVGFFLAFLTLRLYLKPCWELWKKITSGVPFDLFCPGCKTYWYQGVNLTSL